jgi:hypothetical protein
MSYFDIILYRLIALEMLYNFAFKFISIGRSVRTQIGVKVAGSARHLAGLCVQTQFPAERLVTSNSTQKTFDRGL